MSSKDKEVATVRMKPEIKSYLKGKAKEEGMSFSSFLEKVIENGTTGNVIYNDNRKYITNNYYNNKNQQEEECKTIDVEYSNY